MIKDCIRISFLSRTKDASLTYVYDQETQLLHLDKFNKMMGDRSMTPSEAMLTHVLKSNFDIVITSRKNIEGWTPRTFIEQPDFSTAVTLMEKKGNIATRKSDGVMATDERVFWYVSTPGREYQVDCLGTVFCRDITEEFYAVWSVTFG